jgi:hypothetical protein
MTWHYTLAKTNFRLLQYQRLTDHPDAATVEDQLGGARTAVSVPEVKKTASHPRLLMWALDGDFLTVNNSAAEASRWAARAVLGRMGIRWLAIQRHARAIKR